MIRSHRNTQGGRVGIQSWETPKAQMRPVDRHTSPSRRHVGTEAPVERGALWGQGWALGRILLWRLGGWGPQGPQEDYGRQRGPEEERQDRMPREEQQATNCPLDLGKGESQQRVTAWIWGWAGGKTKGRCGFSGKGEKGISKLRRRGARRAVSQVCSDGGWSLEICVKRMEPRLGDADYTAAERKKVQMLEAFSQPPFPRVSSRGSRCPGAGTSHSPVVWSPILSIRLSPGSSTEGVEEEPWDRIKGHTPKFATN